jgi:hypothetical protein
MASSQFGRDALITKATERYFREAEANGHIPMQPGRHASFARNNEVVLANANGLLARYQVKRNGRLGTRID